MSSGLTQFPRGTLGGGLAVLRATMAVVTLEASSSLSARHEALQIIGVLMALALCAGFHTRALASAALVAAAYAFGAGAAPVDGMVSSLMAGVSLILCGPGAYSADACDYVRKTTTRRAGPSDTSV